MSNFNSADIAAFAPYITQSAQELAAAIAGQLSIPPERVRVSESGASVP